jgi:hypothetical protein
MLGKMLGKTLYKTKVRHGKIIVEERTITKVGSKYYYFGGSQKCYISDVGVTVFLTKKEVVEFLIARLRRSIQMGEKYVEREKQQLKEAKAKTMIFPEK